MLAHSRDRLQALAELERRYDGALPFLARRAVLAGSATAVMALHAEGQERFFAGLARLQLRAIRLRRADGNLHAGLISDLALYRRERARWRRLRTETVILPPDWE
jgi:hypothetical protein